MLLWEAHLKLENKKPQHTDPVLFSPKKVDYSIPNIKSEAVIDAYDQIELLSFPLCSYFDLLNAPLPTTFTALKFSKHINKQISICGKLVTAKGTPTKDKRLMHFGTFLDINGTFFDTVHFPNISEKYNISSNGIYFIRGKVVDDLGCVAIIVDYIERLHIVPDPRFADVGKSVKLM